MYGPPLQYSYIHLNICTHIQMHTHWFEQYEQHETDRHTARWQTSSGINGMCEADALQWCISFHTVHNNNALSIQPNINFFFEKKRRIVYGKVADVILRKHFTCYFINGPFHMLLEISSSYFHLKMWCRVKIN